MHEMIVILDFGGQYNQLIARRVRECNVYCEVKSYKTPLEEIKAMNPKGIIFTGGPNSVYLEDSPSIGKEIFELGVPVLGICYGCQLMSHVLGGKVESATTSEYGKTETFFNTDSLLFKGLKEESITWMSHTDLITGMPEGFTSIAHTSECPVAAMENKDAKLYGMQYHPEVMHTENGTAMLRNFLYEVCECRGDWSMSNYAQTAIQSVREKVGDGKVLLALSGGVDSSVLAALLSKAVGNQLTCIFVDHGLLRKNEGDEVEKTFKEKFDMNLIRVNAQDRFLGKLKGVSDPETKRKIIGRDFLKVFKAESEKLGKLDYFAQGTIYPDVIESGQATGAAVIKSHHNVGGLPKELGFTQLIEPLRMLFKDEVRALGETLGLPHDLVWRQPFPGPGLAIRVIGDLTPEKVEIVRESDAVLREEIAKAGLDADIHQYFTVLTGIRSVGVMGDERTYDYTVAIRAVTTDDFMTADWARIPYDVVRTISARIVNEVLHVNRVVLDVTTKPPASIEWE